MSDPSTRSDGGGRIECEACGALVDPAVDVYRTSLGRVRTVHRCPECGAILNEFYDGGEPDD